MKCFPSKAKHFYWHARKVKTETEEQQKLENKKHGTIYAVHLMRVTSEVRLDKATWSSNARTLRVVMKETSEMRLWI